MKASLTRRQTVDGHVFIKCIDAVLSEPQRQQARDAARAETWSYPGEAAKRTVDYLLEKLQAQKMPETERTEP